MRTETITTAPVQLRTCKKRLRQLTPDEVLSTLERVTVFAKWAPATGLFHRRYRVGEEEGDGIDE